MTPSKVFSRIHDESKKKINYNRRTKRKKGGIYKKHTNA